MEKSIALLDFETVDRMVQIHGPSYTLTHSVPVVRCLVRLDYEGVGLSSRTESSKKAASEASKIFQDHYPEFLVCLPTIRPRSLTFPDLFGISSVPQIFCQRTLFPHLDFLVVQTVSLVGHSR